jgi:hypothetical protein
MTKISIFKFERLRRNWEKSFGEWEILYTYWLSNMYSNEEKFVVPVILSHIRKMQSTSAWYKTFIM